MFGAVILIYVKCTKLAEFIFEKTPLPSQKLFDSSMIFLKISHLNSSSFEWLKIKFFIPLLKPIFKCVRNFPTVKNLFSTKLPTIFTQEGKFELRNLNHEKSHI